MKETEIKFFEENNILYNDILEKYYYIPMRECNDLRRLELILLPYCNLHCKYCYVHKTYNETYNNFDELTAKQNLTKVLNWYTEQKFQCPLDLFSGELFASQVGFVMLEMIYNHFKNKKLKPSFILIPTNYTFITSEILTSQVEILLSKFESIGINVYLSASFDGKYMEENRPSYGNIIRDDIYYDRCFAFNAKHNFGFHPMIYSEGIEHWKENFLWFSEKFKQYNLDITRLYLLTVRNDEWSIKQCEELYKFYSFLIDWLYNYSEKDSNKFYEYLTRDAFNSLSFSFLNERKGIGCGFQDNLHLRISDLKVFQCHRLMYPDLEIGHYDDNMNFHTVNAELGIVSCAMNDDYFPICSKCPINSICNKGCLGAQFEVHGDMYIPCTTVCRHYFYMLKAIVDGYYRTGVAERYLQSYPQNEKAFKFLKEQKL